MHLQYVFRKEKSPDLQSLCLTIGIAALVWLAVSAAGSASPLGQVPSQASGTAQVIVKFAETSPLGKIIKETRDRTPAENERLMKEVAALSEALSMPLIAKSITSGSELVLAIDVKKILADLRKELQAYPGVSKVSETSNDRKPIFPQVSEEIAVAFSPAAPESTTLAHAGNCANPNDCIQPLVASLSAKTGYQLRGRLLRGRRLGVAIDLGETTQVLMERFKQRDDVEYVQPDFLLRPMESATNES